MSKSERLQVYARLKPLSNQKCQQQIPLLLQNNNSKLMMQTIRNRSCNIKQHQQYNFQQIFQSNQSQNQIFRTIAQPVIDNCLLGYNGTIFAYGQTGSGKTYTMSGGESWEQRGIIPRVLSYIYQQFHKFKHQTHFQLSVSYIQIYNENIYDLLDQNAANLDAQTLINSQQWQRDDESNRMNLSKSQGKVIFCATQEEALDYLMMGNYLRKVSCTAMNQASSRSHCIFILSIKGTDKKTSTQIYSKINLVDLAGSQRISKSHAQGKVLTEAKSINLSLSYLQQVIVALNQKSKNKSKSHIPYRNSLLTTLLKDSLGGNCKTVMIATISSEMDNIQQTTSTLRFSQRVRQIKNEIQKNQKSPLQTRLQILTRENEMLRKKLQSQHTVPSFPDSHLIQSQIQQFMNSQIQQINVQHVGHANCYFSKMKDLYVGRMQDYMKDLARINQKIFNYDAMLKDREIKNNHKRKHQQLYL